jgi:non-ribosomal peptide synthase protein (TIGR01720 family)
MLPAAFVPLESFPLTPNGKLDRRALPSPNFESGGIRAPHTPTEELLAGIFAEVLRLKQVSANMSFFDLGGDSISALKLVSRARKAGFILTLKDIFQHQTIERLARAAIYARNDNDPISIDNPVGGMLLTPIMRFYEEHGSLTNQFNQSILLRPPTGLSSETLVLALSSLTGYHDILRAHLSATGANASLHLEVSPPPLRNIEDRVRTIAVPRVSPTGLRSLINDHYRDAQARLDPESGIMFQVLWFNQAETRESQILLIFHHLVVDGVSWRILVPDFMIALEGAVSGILPAFGSRGASFRRWSEALHADANTLRREQELPVWKEILSNSEPLLPDRNPDPRQDTIATSQGLTLRLSSDITSSLLASVTTVFGCSVNDALLAALSLTLLAWSGRYSGGHPVSVLIGVEGHGREALSNEMDVSRTIGWFTSLFPVRLNPELLPPGSGNVNVIYVSNLIRHIQDQMAALPDHGIGYGMLRYLNPDTASVLANLPRPQFGFNYLGRFAGPSKETQAAVPTIEAGAFSAANNPAAPLIHTIDLTALVQDYVNGSELVASWSWAGRLFPESVIQDLAESWFEMLKTFVQCAAQASNDASLTVTFRHGERMDIHSLPIASAPEDMLLQASAYYPETQTHFIQTLVTIDAQLIATAVDEAFQLLAARNPVLRTSFVVENARVAQIIHSRTEIPVSHHDWRGMPAVTESEKIGEIIAKDASLGTPSGPPILRVSLGTIANDRHQMLLSFNYCAIDGWSFRLLMQEWRLIYKALVQKTTMPANRGSSYGEYLSWLMTKDLRRARSFWKKELEGLDLPTPVAKRPRVYSPAAIGSSKVSVVLNGKATQDIRLLARKAECTENVVFQCAWGLLLSEITDCKDVLFGAAFTGRSVSFKDVENIPGFMVNFLPIRLRLDDHPGLFSLLVSTQAKQHELLDLEYVSLQKIREWRNLEKTHPLFDSVLYFQNLAGISKQQVGFFNHDVPYPLRIDVFPSIGEVGTSIHASYRREHFGPSQVTAMLDQYVEILCKLAKMGSKVSDART